MELIYFNWGFIGKCYKNDLGNRQMFLFFFIVDFIILIWGNEKILIIVRLILAYTLILHS